MPIECTKALMYLIGRLRFSIFWILLTCAAAAATRLVTEPSRSPALLGRVGEAEGTGFL